MRPLHMSLQVHRFLCSFRDASAIIGSLQTCGSEQLRALAYLAKQIYGDYWSVSVFADVGIVVGEKHQFCSREPRSAL